MSDSSGTGNTAPGVTTAAVLLFSWAFLTFVVRCWAKLRKRDSWGSDDTAIAISFLVTLFHVVAICYAVHRGYGNPWPSVAAADVPAIYKGLYAAQILYVVSIGLTKVSTSFFTARFLTRDRNNVKMATSLIIICGAWTVASMFVIAVRGQISQPWATLDGSEILFTRWLGIEISGFLVDLAGLAMSVYFVWGLQMPVKKRLAVSSIFACRLAILPVVACRLWALSPAKHPDPSTPSLTANIFTEATMDLAFMLASITCLKPFLRPFQTGYFVSTAHSGGGGVSGYNTAGKGSRANAYYELSAARSRAEKEMDIKEVLNVQSRERHPDDDRDDQDLIESHARPEQAFRPDRVDHRATAFSSGPAFGRGETEGTKIFKTRDITVSYD